MGKTSSQATIVQQQRLKNLYWVLLKLKTMFFYWQNMEIMLHANAIFNCFIVSVVSSKHEILRDPRIHLTGLVRQT